MVAESAIYVEQLFPAVSSSAQRARWFGVDYLRQVLIGSDDGVDAAVDDARLVISELVTNALNAKPSEVLLAVAVDAAAIRITVGDDAVGQPEPKRPGSSAEHGRGLWVVAQIAKRWGTVAAEGRKDVWAEIPLPADVSAVDL